MKTRNILLALLIVITAASCREEADYTENPSNLFANNESISFTAQFKTVWNIINTGYNFWDVNTDVDWDARYKTYEQKFEALDENYLAQFKELDAKYAYTRMYDSLEVKVNMAYRDTLKAYYDDLTSGLKDHHMQIVLRNPYYKPLSSDETPYEMLNRGIVWTVSPSDNEIKSRDYCRVDAKGNPTNASSTPAETFRAFTDILKQYVGNAKYNVVELDSAYCSPQLSSIGTNGYYIYALIQLEDGRLIPYFWLSGFNNIEKAMYYAGSSSTSDPLNQQANTLINTYFLEYLNMITNLPKEKMAGTIIDVRENGGGAVSDLQNIIGQFLGESTALWESRHKEGMGRYDMSPWVNDSVNIWDDKKIESMKKSSAGSILYNYFVNNGLTKFHRDFAAENIPIVCLCDINSVSCAEMTTGSIQNMPTGYVIGERTYGGHGKLNSSGTVYNLNYCGVVGDETLQTYNFYVYTSNLEGRVKGMPCLEGIGFTPDKVVLYNEAGYKGQFDAALEYLSTK